MTELLNPDKPYIFFIWFVSLWCVITFLIAHISGWRKLSVYYRAIPQQALKKWRFRTAVMRYMTGYGGCLNLAVTARGLQLSLLFIFRVGHPPLLIPWEEIKPVNHDSRLIKGIKLTFTRAPDVPLYLHEKLVKEISQQYHGIWDDELKEFEHKEDAG